MITPRTGGLGREGLDGVVQEGLDVAGVVSAQATILRQTDPVVEGLHLQHGIGSDDGLVGLVLIHILDDAAVQEQVKADWLDERRRELQEQYIDEVLARYEVVFEELPPEETEPPAEARAETAQ